MRKRTGRYSPAKGAKAVLQALLELVVAAFISILPDLVMSFAVLVDEPHEAAAIGIPVKWMAFWFLVVRAAVNWAKNRK